MTKRQEYMKTYNLNYSRSITGLIKRIYAHQVRNCKHRKHPLPAYSSDELQDWFVNNTTAMQVYEAWKASDYDISLTPSIDRLDNSKSYTFSNIEAVSWQENYTRAHRDVSDNKLHNPTLLNGGHTPVVQYDMEGHKVATYTSIKKAATSCAGIHQGISDCCRGLKQSYKEHFWAYLHDEDLLVAKLTPEYLSNVSSTANKSTGHKTTVVTTTDTYTGSVTSVAKELGVSKETLRKWHNGTPTPRKPKPTTIKSIIIQE
jgi:hypothetical protein